MGYQGLIWNGEFSACGGRWSVTIAFTSVGSSIHHCGTRTEKILDLNDPLWATEEEGALPFTALYAKTASELQQLTSVVNGERWEQHSGLNAALYGLQTYDFILFCLHCVVYCVCACWWRRGRILQMLYRRTLLEQVMALIVCNVSVYCMIVTITHLYEGRGYGRPAQVRGTRPSWSRSALMGETSADPVDGVSSLKMRVKVRIRARNRKRFKYSCKNLVLSTPSINLQQ